jgi:hypothetical protein
MTDTPEDPGTTQTDADASSDPASSGSSRFWKIAAVVAVAAAALAMGSLGYLLFAADDSNVGSDVRACIPNRDFTASAPKGGSSGIAGDTAKTETCPRKGDKYVEGLVQEATATGFDLVTMDGDKRSYKVRPADRPYIDVQHAQSHATLGQPVRVYLEKIDGEWCIVYLTDPPLTPGGEPVEGADR